jgi:membrane protein
VTHFSRPAAWWGLTKQVASSWLDDYVPSTGAALAYYTIFSLAAAAAGDFDDWAAVR